MNYSQLRARYTEVLKRYMDVKPQNRVGGLVNASLSAELDYLECAMLDNPPPGCRRGLMLPEDMPILPSVPMLASLTLEDLDIKVSSDSEIVDTISSRDRTPPDNYVRTIANQGANGSCAGDASAGLTACRHNQDGEDVPQLNGYFSYHWTSGGRDQGSTLHDNLAICQEYGQASEAVWPRSKGFLTKPSDAAMEDALNYRLAKDGVAKINNWQEFMTMVLSGFPIQFGYTGHSIFASDIIDLSRFTYVNSWGDWGNNGRGTLSKDRIYWGYGCYAALAPRGKD